MTDRHNPELDPAGLLERIEREKARILAEAAAQAAALDQKKAEIAHLLESAAKHGYVLTPRGDDRPAPKTVSDLIGIYKSLENSPYKNLTHASRKHYDALLGLLEADYGHATLAKLNTTDFETWHAKWSEGGTHAVAHAKLKMVRLIIGFGNVVLRDDVCERLSGALSKLTLKAPKSRTAHLTPEQATLVRNMAHVMKRPSIALAQAFQSDVGILQKDTIGEWVPLDQDGVSDITEDGMKWVRGLRWSEIDQNMILRHPSEGWQSSVEFDLRNAPMVQEELKRQFNFTIGNPRFLLPINGPIIVSEYDKVPYEAVEFRRWWRRVADECKIPRNVRNSDSRSRVKERYQEVDVAIRSLFK